MELTQEAFLRLHREWDRRDRSRDPAPWLFAVVRNLALDLLRRRSARQECGLDHLPAASSAPAPDALAMQNQVAARLWTAIAALPLAQREVLLLRDWHGLSYGEIAQVTGASLGRSVSSPLNVVMGAGAVQDVTGDNRPDLITTFPGPGVLAVLPGLGDGRFGAPLTTAAGLLPSEFALGDFSGDGIMDVVTANANGEDVNVLVGVGDGSFPFRRQYAAGGRPVRIAAADVDGDGRTDAVILTGNNIGVMAGNGDGTLAPVRNTGLRSASAVFQVGDLDGDGRSDVVTGLDSGELQIFAQGGNGAFGSTTFLPLTVRRRPDSIWIADLNADGIADLVAAAQGTVQVLLGRGGGSFAPATAMGVRGSPFDLKVADVTGDKVVDILAFAGDQISVLQGVGDGTFSTAVRFAAGGGRLAVADVTGDGKPDLVVVSSGVTVLPAENRARVDAAQLVKHALGLSARYKGRQVQLVYLYWEPRNAADWRECRQHRAEVEDLVAKVSRSAVRLIAMNCQELWTDWGAEVPEHWLYLRTRYDSFLLTSL